MNAELEAWLKAECNRHTNGFCHTRHCLVRGGYLKTKDHDCATCEAHEILEYVRALEAAALKVAEDL